MDFAELHFHLLPGVDDGPSSLADSLALAAAAVDDGTGTILVTPHVNRTCVTDVSLLPDLLDELAEALRGAGIPIELHLGGELAHDMVSRLSQADLETIAQGPRGRRWLLLEAPLEGLDASFAAAASELRERGFAVVVAHPERSLAVSEPAAWRIIEAELAAGSAMQVNAWSLIGELGPAVARAAERVLSTATRAVIASDAHGPHRPPALRDALAELERLGEREPQRRLGALPRALLRHGLAATQVAPV